MAGTPGRSGGARSGAGRPPKKPELLELAEQFDDPKAFLARVMNSSSVDLKLRIDAGKALMPFEHSKKADQGKKGKQRDQAGQLALDGFFAAPPAPGRLQ